MDNRLPGKRTTVPSYERAQPIFLLTVFWAQQVTPAYVVWKNLRMMGMIHCQGHSVIMLQPGGIDLLKTLKNAILFISKSAFKGHWCMQLFPGPLIFLSAAYHCSIHISCIHISFSCCHCCFAFAVIELVFFVLSEAFVGQLSLMLMCCIAFH